MAKRANLSDKVRNEIEQLVTSNLKPGDKLPTEAEFSEQFDVGRSTIREALKGLEVKGLIIRNNEGSFVSETVNQCLLEPLTLLVNMQIGSVEDLLEIREIIELGAIRIAALKITEEELLELEHLNWQLQEPGADSYTMQVRDIEFHHAIAASTGNTVLVELLDAMRKVIALRVEDAWASHMVIHDMCADHREIINALRTHDGEKAYQVMSDYFHRNVDRGSYKKHKKER